MTEQGRGPSTMSDLDELERLLEATTPGPWRVSDDDPSDVVIWGPSHAKANYETEWVANIEQPYQWAESGTSMIPHKIADAPITDAALIVAAVNSLPALIAEIRQLRQGIRILQDNWPKTIPAPMDVALSAAAESEEG